SCSRSELMAVSSPRRSAERSRHRVRETRHHRRMGLTQYYTATSLDGFIADPNHSLDWLFTRDRDDDGLLSYGAFIAQVGALAMGAPTYEWILDHEFADKDVSEGKWPYAIPCWVFPHRSLTVVP